MYIDLPYTTKEDHSPTTAEWDVAWTLAQWQEMMTQVAAIKGTVKVIIIKLHYRDVDMITRDLKTKDFTVFPHWWEKTDQNIHGTHKTVPSVETLLVAVLKSECLLDTYWARMPSNPLERHGLFISKCLHQSKYIKDTESKKINTSQSPMLLSHEYIPTSHHHFRLCLCCAWALDQM